MVMRKGYTLRNLVLYAFSHSTEDLNKVRQAIINLLPLDLRQATVSEERVVEGHYGNPITLITLRMRDRDADATVFKHIVCSLTTADRSILMATLPRRVGAKNSAIYLRLSKQEALLGRVMLMDGDDVIKVTATVVGVKDMRDQVEYMRGLIEGCK